MRYERRRDEKGEGRKMEGCEVVKGAREEKKGGMEGK